MEPTSTPPVDTPPPASDTPFRLTQAACARIAKLLSDEPEGSKFRIEVQGGGCSGFQYIFDLDAKPEAENDTILRENGAVVAIDKVSLDMLAGSELDYEETLASAGFVVKNPNATARCGCGNSFSL